MRERDTHICKRGRGRGGRAREERERRKGREGRGEGRGGLGREESVQYKFQSELARFSTPRLSDVFFFFFFFSMDTQPKEVFRELAKHTT